jgi:hypothetical protein
MMTTTQMYAIKPRMKKSSKETLALIHQPTATKTTSKRERPKSEMEDARDLGIALAASLSAKIKNVDDFTFVDSDGEEESNCVICIGSTGAGKSATISRCTRRPVSSGNGRDRVTVRCAKYDLRPDAKEEMEAMGLAPSILDLVWVDTVGWDDADLQGINLKIRPILPKSATFF